MRYFLTVQQSRKTEDGFKDWVNMFDKAPFEGMDEALKDEIIEEAEADQKKNYIMTAAGILIT